MADVADGRFWADARPGAPFHRAGARAGPRLWPEALYGRDAPALRRAGSAVGDPRIRRRGLVGCGFRDPRLGMAPPAPQGRAFGFPPRPALVRRADGAPRHQTRHGSEAGLSSSPSPACGGGRRRPAAAVLDGRTPMRSIDYSGGSPAKSEINAYRVIS